MIAVVSKASGKKFDLNNFDDRITIQTGCYILNSWGVEPIYRYP